MSEKTTVYVVNVYLKEGPDALPDVAGVFSTPELAMARIPTAEWVPFRSGSGWFDATEGAYGPEIRPYVLDEAE